MRASAVVRESVGSGFSVSAGWSGRALYLPGCTSTLTAPRMPQHSIACNIAALVDTPTRSGGSPACSSNPEQHQRRLRPNWGSGKTHNNMPGLCLVGDGDSDDVLAHAN